MTFDYRKQYQEYRQYIDSIVESQGSGRQGISGRGRGYRLYRFLGGFCFKADLNYGGRFMERNKH